MAFASLFRKDGNAEMRGWGGQGGGISTIHNAPLPTPGWQHHVMGARWLCWDEDRCLHVDDYVAEVLRIFAITRHEAPLDQMKHATACNQCRQSKRRCARAGIGEPCGPCAKRGLRCAGRSRLRLGPRASLFPKEPSSNDESSARTLNIPQSTIEELVEYYLIKIHDRPHSLFHPPTLRTQVRNRAVNKALLFAICSMGSRFSLDPRTRSLEETLTAESKRLLQAELENICLENIQACILIANLCACHSSHQSEVLFFRIANSMSQILGLDAQFFSGPVVECEIRRRVWWALFMADHWCSSAIGLPRQIDNYDDTVGLPMDESMFYKMSSEQQILEGDWRPGLWAHMVSLVQHFGPIQELSRLRAEGGATHEQLACEVERIFNQLELWESILPDDAKMTRENLGVHQNKGTGGAFVALHLGYHHYSTLLLFPFLEDQSSTSEFDKMCISRCKRHASEYSSLLRLAREEPDCEAVYPTVGHMAVVSSSVLLHTLLFGNELELQTARAGLQSNFEALIELKEYWPSVDAMVQRLSTFQDVCLLSMGNQAHKLDGWMVRFLIEQSLPLGQKEVQMLPPEFEWESENLSIIAQGLTEQGRYTEFSI